MNQSEIAALRAAVPIRYTEDSGPYIRVGDLPPPHDKCFWTFSGPLWLFADDAGLAAIPERRWETYIQWLNREGHTPAMLDPNTEYSWVGRAGRAVKDPVVLSLVVDNPAPELSVSRPATHAYLVVKAGDPDLAT